jgi:hypothetical protein
MIIDMRTICIKIFLVFFSALFLGIAGCSKAKALPGTYEGSELGVKIVIYDGGDADLHEKGELSKGKWEKKDNQLHVTNITQKGWVIIFDIEENGDLKCMLRIKDGVTMPQEEDEQFILKKQ